MSVALFKNNDVIAGRITRTYTYGPGIDNIQSMTIYDEYGGSETYYYIKDASNTVHVLVDEDGLIVEYYYYDAFGNLKMRDVNYNLITESVYGNRFLFQGREYDYDTALYYFRARWYEPETGRWLSPDPIGFSGGLNLYAFCGNDPVNFIDPMGYAHFGIRPLDMPCGIYFFDFSKNDSLFNFFNIGFYHEHLFFDDGSGDNIGFFKGRTEDEFRYIGRDEYIKEHGCETDYYKMSSDQYDDVIMKQAVEFVNNRIENENVPYSLCGWGWGVKKYNCQDWCSEVRETYFLIKYGYLLY